MTYEDCNMIDINPESSISTSHSNSMLSKSSNTDENPMGPTHSAKRSASSMKHGSDGHTAEHEIGGCSFLARVRHFTTNANIYSKLMNSITYRVLSFLNQSFNNFNLMLSRANHIIQ